MLTFADLKSLIKIKWEEITAHLLPAMSTNCPFQPFILPSSLKNVNESLRLPFFAYSRFNKNI